MLLAEVDLIVGNNKRQMIEDDLNLSTCHHSYVASKYHWYDWDFVIRHFYATMTAKITFNFVLRSAKSAEDYINQIATCFNRQ